MTDRPSNTVAGLPRRGLLRWGGLLGAGAALANFLGTHSVSHANVGPMVAAKPTTRLLEAHESRFRLGTGPFQSFGTPAGTRVGLCILYAGGVPGRGPASSIESIEAVAVDSDEFAPFDRDLAVENSVYRVLDALNVARPIELSGWSTTVIEGAGRKGTANLEVTWEVTLGRGGAPELQKSLDGFHALVFGQLSRDSKFESRLSYVQVGVAD